jgi:acetyl-CoA carboxylase biotin carboxyl carrier protein
VNDQHPGDPTAEPSDPTTVLEAVYQGVARLANVPSGPPRRIKVRCGDTTIELEWPQPAAGGAPAAVRPAEAGAADEAHLTGQESDLDLHFVRAPMVGTFYHAPEPGAPPFVSVGDVIEQGQTVGVLEVMKLMNHIESDVTGRVVELLTPDAHPVEVEQRLIAVSPVSVN